jgi:putative ABC transport system substrate-binding protein
LHRLQRRDLITLLVGTRVLSPFTVRAQQQDRMRRVGVIMGFAEDDEVWQAYLATFRQRLQDFGWTDGRNIRFDYLIHDRVHRFIGETGQCQEEHR